MTLAVIAERLSDRMFLGTPRTSMTLVKASMAPIRLEPYDFWLNQ
jgi:hypothetical protein